MQRLWLRRRSHRRENRELRVEIDRLWQANSELVLERDVTNQLLGQALDLPREFTDRTSADAS